jgi:hypothetical protein
LDHQPVLDLGRLVQRADKFFPRVNDFTDECRTAIDPPSTDKQPVLLGRHQRCTFE